MFGCPPQYPLTTPPPTPIRYFPKHTNTTPPLSPLLPSPRHKTTNSTTELRMENHVCVFGRFTILVFQANFMVSVSFMIREQHQSSGIVLQGQNKL